MLITKRIVFEASHILPRHPGKCSRLHGHSWQVTVGVEGEIQPDTGFVMDYATLGALLHTHIFEVCDHQHLGYGDVTIGGVWPNIKNVSEPTEMLMDVRQQAVFGPTFYPTSENLAQAFGLILQPLVKEHGAELAWVVVSETGRTTARWMPDKILQLRTLERSSDES